MPSDISSPTDVMPSSVSGENSALDVSKDNKNTKDLRESDIVSQILRYREEAWHRDYVLRDKWLQCYQQMRGHQDFTDKAPWQSRLVLGKGHAAVKQFVANLFKLWRSSEQWITVDPGEANPELKKYAPMVEGAVLKLTDTPECRLETRDALEFGGSIGVMAMRIDWAYGEKNELSTYSLGRDGSSAPSGGAEEQRIGQKSRKEGYIKFTSVDPFHLWWGPRTKGGREFDWVMEESYADIASLKAQGAFQNLDKIYGDTPDQSAITRSYEQQRKDKRIAPETTRKQIHLLEYWGDLVESRTNTVAATNRHIIIANRTNIIKNEANPYWDRRPPYILSSPLIVAGRFPGQGILEIPLPILNEINKVAQQMSDHLSISVVPMFEVEATALENPDGDMQTGIQPGKVFYRKAGAGMQAVMGVQMPQLSAGAFNWELALDKEVQRSTFITEIAQGLTDAKGETTATEVNVTSQYASVLMGDISQHIEDNFLTPLAECVWSRAFQFLDSTSKPTWTELIGPEIGSVLDSMSREQRVKISEGRYTFKAHGLSRALQRQQNVQRYEQFLGTISQMAPQLLALIDAPKMLLRIFEAEHFPEPEELLPPNVREAFEKLQAGLLAQQNPADMEAAKSQGAIATAGAQGDQSAIGELVKAFLAHSAPQQGATQT
jgi:hypothetical protein